MPNEKQNDKFLTIKKEMEEIQNLYRQDKNQQTFNCLILGEMGTGKTHLLQTCRRPIHIDSFDPGGKREMHHPGNLS